MTNRKSRHKLLASCSIAAVLVASCPPSVLAACMQVGSGGADNPAGQTVAGYCVTNTSFTGAVANEGTIAPSGITLANGTITGQITSSGVILGGIALDQNSAITSGKTAIAIGGPTFLGGIANAGAISGAEVGIRVGAAQGTTSASNVVSSFYGGISNSGTISSGGIIVNNVNIFSGGISNSGALSGAGGGISLSNLSNFSGGISNSGSMSNGIGLIFLSTFSGDISNSGTITANSTRTGVGISVYQVTSFAGSISNSGTISGLAGIGIVGSTINGAIVDSGVILAGPGNAIFVNAASQINAGKTAIAITGPTFTGGISNAGTIQGKTGILIGAGVSLGSGDAIINSGTITGSTAAIDVSKATSPVTINQTSGLISGAINLSAYADVLNITGGSIAGSILGQGSSNTINFAPGAGNTFTYDNSVFVRVNQVNINSGLVVLNYAGSNAVSFNVTSGGTLAGKGLITVAPPGSSTVNALNVNNGATLWPGVPGSAGTLTLAANVIFASGATYQDTFRVKNAGLTAIDGAATLGGATVVIAAGSTPILGMPYTILTDTAGGLGGGNIFNPNVSFNGQTGTLTYDATDVFLTLGVAPVCYSGPFPSNNSGSLPCIKASGTSFSGNIVNAASGVIGPGSSTGVGILVSSATIGGNISNAGAITAPTGIGLVGATINGAIIDNGVIQSSLHGILVDSASQINSNKTGIAITGATFSGGISNAGAISAGGDAIGLLGVSAFSGGVSNSGAISAPASAGVSVGAVSNFAGNIYNTGAIAAKTGVRFVGSTINGVIFSSGNIIASTAGVTVDANSAIVASGLTARAIGIYSPTFTGGVTNFGTLSVTHGPDDTIPNPLFGTGGIAVGLAYPYEGVGLTTSFGGNVSNAGTISTDYVGIEVRRVGSFSGSIINSGSIAAASTGIFLYSTKFGGGITNSGTISAGGAGIFAYAGSTFSGDISNSGTIAGGIFADVGQAFLGGVSNSGVISAARFGIVASPPSTLSRVEGDGGSFAGNISNSGTISGNAGIFVGGISGLQYGITHFSGGITNSGVISAAVAPTGALFGAGAGVAVTGVSTFSGNISNSGSIFGRTGIAIGAGVGFASGSAIINSGTISGSVSAIGVSAATSPVTIDQTGGLISGAIKLSANADVLNISGGTIAGNIVGAGASNIINFAPGAGNEFDYGAAYGFSGVNQVNINSGQTVLNGANSAQYFTVNSGGTLAGTGTLTGTGTVTSPFVINSGGVLQPGATGVLGTFTLTGNLTFSAGAAYLELIGNTVNSKTVVNGLATLGGAMVTIAPGSYAPNGVKYTILTDTSGGLGVGGNIFNPLVSYKGVTGTLTYDANDVYLTFGAASGCYSAPFPSSNAAAISCIKASGTSFAGSIVNAASGVISPGSSSGVGILVSSATISGNISNAGTISAPTGISLVGATMNGAIIDSGVIQATGHGILIDANSKIVSTKTAVAIGGPTFTGGISNAGAISGGYGVFVYGNPSDVSIFSGGINNSGTISAGHTGIGVEYVANFAGGIGNSGTISATARDGILVRGVTTFAGGISNGGKISASYGISVSSVSQFGSSSAGGGITNTGTISAGLTGIVISYYVANFAGGISNSGVISAVDAGIYLDDVPNFSGGITNTGTISTGKTGIYLYGSGSFSGGISNGGLITAGYSGIELYNVTNFFNGITNSGTISASSDGVSVDHVTSFSGGISNGGTISAAYYGVYVNFLDVFSGGISNSGTISASTVISPYEGGISVNGLNTFSGGIANSGMVFASVNSGIAVGGVSSFSGGISNSGTISAAADGIYLRFVTSFSGNIGNSGTITAKTGISIWQGVTFSSGSALVNSGTITGSAAAIDLTRATSPVTIDQTGGLISGAIKLSANADVLNVTGGAVAGNILGLGSADTVNFAPGAGNTFTYASPYGFSGVNQVNINSGTVVLNGVNSATDIAVNS
ncbi:hypothetical protein, partial [uncultured Rhodoblastus sp.]|uniref:beta strand repeat-containing protein n=1 Tax=uncultured Rhodoblastus sp. TaxID=543037 RepID=UPI0025D45FEE